MIHTRPELVILGTGFGGFSLAKNIDHDLYSVTVVSPRNHFIFTPLLPSTTVGTIEFRSIIEPIRGSHRQLKYVQALCTSLDVKRKIVRCKSVLDASRFDLTFDKLVIAVGMVSNTFGVSGVEKYALYLKDLTDARAIRQRIIDCFERAAQPSTSMAERKRLLHFVVVGGGPTGIEFAAEMHDFLTEDLSKAYAQFISEVQITLLEAGKQILNTFDEELSRYTRKLFRRQRIVVKTNSPVVRVEKTIIHLADRTKIPYGLVVWSTGVGATKFIKSLRLQKDGSSRLVVDEYLRVLQHESIYAVGDCAAVRGKSYPATAQVAEQQGAYLAKALNRERQGKQVPSFKYRHKGMLAYVGGGKALADLAAFKGKGFVTWLFWRSTYLTKLVSLKNKTLVLFDWFKTFVFGRDISRF